MREFNESDFPPFLEEYKADHQDSIGVETTIAELNALGYSLPFVDEDCTARLLPPAFVDRYGNRRVFAIINFPRKSVERRTNVFIEVTDARDAEAIRQALSDVYEDHEIAMEDEDDSESCYLSDFRWFIFR